jgi:hypothetical protein
MRIRDAASQNNADPDLQAWTVKYEDAFCIKLLSVNFRKKHYDSFPFRIHGALIIRYFYLLIFLLKFLKYLKVLFCFQAAMVSAAPSCTIL